MFKNSVSTARIINKSARPVKASVAASRSRLLAPPIDASFVNTKRYASVLHPNPDDLPPKRGFKISHLFGGLAALGLLVTTYGLLEYYYSLNTWPQELRTDLRAALKAKNRGEFARSEKYFQRALDTALTLSPEAFGEDPILKLSGIAISLSSLLEEAGQPSVSYMILLDALRYYGIDAESTCWAGPTYRLTEKDEQRIIALHQKLGQLSLGIASDFAPPLYPAAAKLVSSSTSTTPQREITKWDQAAEHHLSTALTTLLKLGAGTRDDLQADKQFIAGRDTAFKGDSEALPEDGLGRGGVTKRGLGMTMEALAEVYAMQGKYDLAAPLLLQAISTLLPANATVPPPTKDRCQAALLMTTLSSHLLHPPNSTAVKNSRSWSLKALQTAEGVEDGLCQRATSVALYNMGMLAEMDKDPAGALKHFTKALALARETGFAEGKREAIDAIRRVRGATQ